ncbi:hypothetical protein KQX54_001910 [Cotesia glomerata]|uniref:Uncharacterized protein n=1 Tax=Cotesia glomerata TaxID=32391 RepID=A0AAV7IC16_COTGL|nr:hypothetical protein KQX54_001910 [Cotesia glomerata]
MSPAEIYKVKEIRKLEYEVRQLEREVSFYGDYVARFNNRGLGDAGYRGRGDAGYRGRGDAGYRGRGSYQPY